MEIGRQQATGARRSGRNVASVAVGEGLLNLRDRQICATGHASRLGVFEHSKFRVRIQDWRVGALPKPWHIRLIGRFLEPAPTHPLGSPPERPPGSPGDYPPEPPPGAPEDASPGAPEDSPVNSLPGAPENPPVDSPAGYPVESPEDALPESLGDSPPDCLPDSPPDSLAGSLSDGLGCASLTCARAQIDWSEAESHGFGSPSNYYARGLLRPRGRGAIAARS